MHLALVSGVQALAVARNTDKLKADRMLVALMPCTRFDLFDQASTFSRVSGDTYLYILIFSRVTLYSEQPLSHLYDDFPNSSHSYATPMHRPPIPKSSPVRLQFSNNDDP